jgi:hypothetical protein
MVWWAVVSLGLYDGYSTVCCAEERMVVRGVGNSGGEAERAKDQLGKSASYGVENRGGEME